MKLMLDTHTLLWAIGKTNELSEKAALEIKDANNDVCVSAVSLWEIALKQSVGKLIVDFDIINIPEYCMKMGFELIPLDPADALNSMQLPQKDNHKDPFDRMLIYQCIVGNYTLISKDIKMALYAKDGLKSLW